MDNHILYATQRFLDQLKVEPDAPRIMIAGTPSSFHSLEPPPAGYPANPKTIGEHIRKRRLDLSLLQREVAEIIGVDECTIHNWECTHSRPQALLIPKVIEFLSCNPFAKDDSNYPVYLETFGDHLLKRRLDEGITQKYLAQNLGVSVYAIRDWERNRTEPRLEHRNRTIEFLGYDPF